MRKVYVKVKAEFDTAGFLSPLSLTWEDGREFPIDRVLDAQRAASRKAGGIGTRYTVRIQGRERYLWFENPAWFGEAPR